MKKNQAFKFLFFLSVICIVAGLSVLHSCKEDVEPFYINDVDYLVKVTVVDSKTKDNLSDVTALVTYPDKTQKIIPISDGILSINMDKPDDGQLILQFDKESYVSIIDTITIDRSDVDEGAICDFLRTVMLTKINVPFEVPMGVDMDISVIGSDAKVEFSKNCLSSNANISITEMPSADEIAAEGGGFDLIGGRVALKSFHFLPEGQTFEEPIKVTFDIPDISSELEFSTFVDDDEDGIGEWESVEVLKNGDGTGTAEISHFSDWYLSTYDRWEISYLNFSDPTEFIGDCDVDLVADFEQSFNSDETEAKDDLPFCIQYELIDTKVVDRHLGYKKSISCKYMVSRLKNVSKVYAIEIPSFPVELEPSSEDTCHTGGAGS